MQPPVWFRDASAVPVVELLRWFVIQLNKIEQQKRQKNLSRKLNSRNFPALFNYIHADEIDFIKEALYELAKPPYEIWNISVSRDEQLTVVLNFEAEATLRAWLGMPRVDPFQQAWIEAIDNWKISPEFDIQPLKLSAYPGIYPPAALLNALSCLNKELQEGAIELITWRRLSARFFFGDSKYLESVARQQWLLSLFPRLLSQIESRALLFNAFLVEKPAGILLVENQDTFCWLMKIQTEVECLQNLHLVYSQGFMGSAHRSRDVNAVRFMYHGSLKSREEFHTQWLREGEMILPLYFWGDLDFAGMTILKSLRQVFPSTTAWVPGYRPMVQSLLNGTGHLPDQANKLAQSVIDSCGCRYADSILIPALSKTGRCLDQEWVSCQLLAAYKPSDQLSESSTACFSDNF